MSKYKWAENNKKMFNLTNDHRNTNLNKLKISLIILANVKRVYNVKYLRYEETGRLSTTGRNVN